MYSDILTFVLHKKYIKEDHLPVVSDKMQCSMEGWPHPGAQWELGADGVRQHHCRAAAAAPHP